jgi:hypothetical protein
MRKALLTAATAMVFGLFVGAMPAHAQDADAKIAALEKKVADIEAKQTSVTLHGYIRSRYYNGQAMKSTINVEEISLNPHMIISPNMEADLNFFFYPQTSGTQAASTLYVAQANVIVKSLPFNGRLIVGKDRNWTYGITPSGPNRLLSNYSLYSDTFTHDRVTGMQYIGKLGANKSLDFGVAVVNGYVVGSRNIGIPSQPVVTPSASIALANRDGNMNLDNNYAISARLGGNIISSLNIGASGYYGKVSPTDMTSLAGLLPANTTISMIKRNKTQYGLDLKYVWQGLVIQAEGTEAKTGDLKYNGAQTQIAYNFDPKNCLIGQYGMVNFTDSKLGTATAAKTATWDKTQIALSFKHKLNKKASLQLEQEFNREKVPGALVAAGAKKRIKNDVTFLEFFVAY